MEAFKQQQARWAQGSVQCLRKLSWRIVASDLSLLQKVMALVHMSGYFTQPLVVAMLLISLPLVLLPRDPQPLGMVLSCLQSDRRCCSPWRRPASIGTLGVVLLYFPLLLVVGAGITWSTTGAVWEGLALGAAPFTGPRSFRSRVGEVSGRAALTGCCPIGWCWASWPSCSTPLQPGIAAWANWATARSQSWRFFRSVMDWWPA